MKTTLPAEVQNDIQEKLAWAISNYDEHLINEAINAGANPFTCHKTKLAGPYFLANRIEALLDAEEISPYYILFYTPQRAALGGHAADHKLLATAEVLLKNGVSVDKKPSSPCHGFGYTLTFREQVDHWLKEFEVSAHNKHYALAQEEKELLANQSKIMRELLTLMRTYQSEPAGYEYVSSYQKNT